MKKEPKIETNIERLAKMRHDLRNPLTVMKLSLETFDYPSLSPEAEKKLRTLVKLLNKEIKKMTTILKRR